MKQQIPVRIHAVAESPEPPVDDYQHLPICGWGDVRVWILGICRKPSFGQRFRDATTGSNHLGFWTGNLAVEIPRLCCWFGCDFQSGLAFNFVVQWSGSFFNQRTNILSTVKLYISIISFRFKEHVITSQLGAPPTLNHQRSRRGSGSTPILESSVSAYLKSRKISVTVVAPMRSYWSYGQARGAVQGYRRHHPLGLFATWVVPVGHLAWPLQSVAGPGAQHLRWPVGHGGPFETFCNDRSHISCYWWEFFSRPTIWDG